MMYGGRFNKLDPKYIGDNNNNGVWGINEVYALREAGVWPGSVEASKDIYFDSNSLLLTSRTANITDVSNFAISLNITKFTKQIIVGPNNFPVNAIYNDDYSDVNGSYASIVTSSNTNLSINSKDYTIECWFKPIKRQPNGYYTLFSTYKNSGDGAVFGFDNDGRIFADGGFGNWVFGNITGGINVSAGSWHHIVFVKSGTSLKCFVNGVQYGSTANTTKIHTATTIRIGNYDNQSFVGHMTELRFSIGVARYTSNFTAPSIPFSVVEQETPPFTPALSVDALYGDQSIELFWDNAFNGGSDITSYDIAYSINSDMSGANVNNLSISEPTLPTSYTITGLSNGTPYYCSIRANNIIGSSSYSNIVGPITPSSVQPQRLIGGDFGVGVGSDPYEYNVSLLLHGDGSNGSTSIVDASTEIKTIMLTGDVSISTSQSRFGGGSIYFDGNGDSLSVGMSNDFNFASNNFTIEFWINPSSYNPNYSRLVQSRDADTYAAISIGLGPSGELSIYSSNNGSNWNVIGISSVTTIPLSTWTHIAVVRNNNSLLVFIDGVLINTYGFSGSLYYNANDKLIIGGQTTGTNRSFNGYLDELRITNYVARYTSDFILATASFPNPSIRPMYAGVSFGQDDSWYSTSTANKIFDNNLTDNNDNQWKATSLNRAFGIDFGISQQVLRYRMWRNTGNQNTPTNWILQGSNTESDWTNLPNNAGNSTFGTWQTIDTRNNVYLPLVTSSSPANNPYGQFVVASPGNYRYYRLFVSAARADGPGTEASRAWIAEMQFLAVINTPDTPTNLTVYPLNNGASLEWSYKGPLTTYTVEWSSNGGSTVLGSATTNNFLYNVTGLVNGTSYVFRVKATNSAGDSDWTAWSDAVVPAFSAFGPSVSFTKSNYGSEIDTIIPGALSITRANQNGIYNPAAGETGWNSSVSPSNTQWAVGWNNFCGLGTRTDWTTFVNVLQYRIGNNVLGADLVMKHVPTNRYWKIDFSSWQQGAQGGGFAYTRQEFLNCDNSAPSTAPTLTHVLPESSTSLDVYWTPLSLNDVSIIPQPISYIVEWSTDGTNWTASSAIIGVSSSNYTITGLTNGTTYTVRVKATNSVGSGQPSNTLTGTPGTATGFGPTLTVTEANYAFPSTIDYIVPGSLHLTRGSAQGLYNAVNQTGWDGNGPSDTEWTRSWTNECDLSGRSWSSFYYIWGGGGIGNYIVNDELIMRQISTGKMWFIKFSVWSNQYSGAGYTYTRKRFYGC